MSSDNIHYDYCRCCGAWMKAAVLDEDGLCRYCWGTYGEDWQKYAMQKLSPAAPLSNDL